MMITKIVCKIIFDDLCNNYLNPSYLHTWAEKCIFGASFKNFNFYYGKQFNFYPNRTIASRACIHVLQNGMGEKTISRR